MNRNGADSQATSATLLWPYRVLLAIGVMGLPILWPLFVSMMPMPVAETSAHEVWFIGFCVVALCCVVFATLKLRQTTPARFKLLAISLLMMLFITMAMLIMIFVVFSVSGGVGFVG